MDRLLEHLLEKTNLSEQRYLTISGINSILKIYRAQEKGLEPRDEDLDEALIVLKVFLEEFLEIEQNLIVEYEEDVKKALAVGDKDSVKSWKAGINLARRNIKRFTKRLDEVEQALRRKFPKIIAIDNVINQWHVDITVFGHVRLDIEFGEKYKGKHRRKLKAMWDEVEDLMDDLGRLPKESGHLKSY